ncbi:MAG: hypothetical protein GX660_16065, partial [Clostridiaceae bacterium]|nr:hypothetical protein [Clostridiaceae bacterium]
MFKKFKKALSIFVVFCLFFGQMFYLPEFGLSIHVNASESDMSSTGSSVAESEDSDTTGAKTEIISVPLPEVMTTPETISGIASTPESTPVIEPSGEFKEYILENLQNQASVVESVYNTGETSQNNLNIEDSSGPLSVGSGLDLPKDSDSFTDSAKISVAEAVYDNEPPTVPQNLSISYNTDTSVSLVWEESTDNVAVSGYKVYLNNMETAITTETGYTYSPLLPGELYSFTVRAFDEAGNESDESNAAIYDNEPPASPKDLKIVSKTHTSLSLSWLPSTDNYKVISYSVYLNSQLAGETSDTAYLLSGLSPDTDYEISVKAKDASDNYSSGSVLNARTLVQPMYVNSNMTLQEDKKFGDFYLQGGTLDLNGYRLTIEGNLIQTGGTLYVNGGQLEVSGDYRIDNNGSYVNAYLKMVNEADYVMVGGNFRMYSWYSHKEYLTAGTMELKGNFTQNGHDYSPYYHNFNASGTHKVILSGEDTQDVYFRQPGQSCFNILELKNYSEGGVKFTSALAARKLITNGCTTKSVTVGSMNWELTEDITIKGDLILNGSTLDLNGCKLTIEGNLTQTGGTLYVNGGQLEVSGNYRIDNNGSYVNAYLKMINEADYLKVGGNFRMYSWYSHKEYL